MARVPRRRVSVAPSSGSAERRSPRAHENLPRPAAPTPAATAGGAAAIRRRGIGSVFGKLTPRIVGDVIAELRKVTWPTFEETRYLTMVVAVVSVAVGLLLGGVDLAFGWIIEKLFF